VAVICVELAGGDVHADLDLAGVAGLVDGGGAEGEALHVVEDVGREAALVAHVARVLPVPALDHALQRVVDLGAHLHGLAEAVRARRQQHELLHGQRVARVAATVYHVERRHLHSRKQKRKMVLILSAPKNLKEVFLKS